MYKVMVPKLDQKPKIFSSLKVALINSICRLNIDNGRCNVIVDATSKDIIDSLYDNNGVCLYTQFGDQILVERIIGEVSH